MPATLKLDPVVFAWVTVTLVPPELVRLSDRVCLLPTRTLPKLRLGGFALSAPTVCPVPERATLTVGTALVFAIARFPLTAPADCGVKITLNG